MARRESRALWIVCTNGRVAKPPRATLLAGLRAGAPAGQQVSIQSLSGGITSFWPTWILSGSLSWSRLA